MNKAILISIQPRWCDKIFDGFKNVEFRKTMPKLPLPFKAYVYCTQKRERLLDIINDGEDLYGDIYHGKPIFIKTDATSQDTSAFINGWCGKVIGEIMVDRMEEVTVDYSGENPVAVYGGVRLTDMEAGYFLGGGLTLGEYVKYKGKGKVYGWHIAETKLYKKPVDVREYTFVDCLDRVKRPPQSWCYVKEKKYETVL